MSSPHLTPFKLSKLHHASGCAIYATTSPEDLKATGEEPQHHWQYSSPSESAKLSRAHCCRKRSAKRRHALRQLHGDVAIDIQKIYRQLEAMTTELHDLPQTPSDMVPNFDKYGHTPNNREPNIILTTSYDPI